MTRIVNLDHVAGLVRQYCHARNEAYRLKAEADQKERQLLEVLGEADVGVVGGKMAVKRTVRSRRPGRPPRHHLTVPGPHSGDE